MLFFRLFLVAFIMFILFACVYRVALAEEVVRVVPGMNPAKVAESNPAGTTYLISDGTYKAGREIVLHEGDVFRGASRDGTILDMTGAEIGVQLDAAHGARVENMWIKNTKGGNYCEPRCGRGISGWGRDTQILNVRVSNHPNSGLGGLGDGAVVDRLYCHNVGSLRFTLVDGGPSDSACVKSVNDLTVKNSRIENFYWNGLWADESSEHVVFENNTVRDGGRTGIQVELANGHSLVKNNRVSDTGLEDRVPNIPSSVQIISSEHVDVESNTVARSRRGPGVLIIGTGSRGPVGDVSIYENILNGEKIDTCRLWYVECEGNR
jgi:hypothetical protein